MSAENYECITHVVPGQHIRHYARGTSERQEDELKLVVKQYKPRYSQSRNSTAVTIIGSHASGCPKELYEPVWNELFQRTKSNESFSIKNIWFADIANQGASGVLNERNLGSEPSYLDHARDLLLMVNHFREELQRPIVGIGHSLGGCVMINLALLHPRLLTTVIAIEPVINKNGLEKHFTGAYPITFKRDTWPTRKEAED
ncbi:hypothetical protein HYALB_00005233 [Hymenoscyphus albidus]|uniref:AB hydrolase-1 domain-containing protein n=1 Tax=Hymenoscyphus albidus TaxID=595503 RepID=A0A9N9LUL3_9HELO|nr:hypothetical protein HYALB_00005233 [Hymenoscyphus albidus]